MRAFHRQRTFPERQLILWMAAAALLVVAVSSARAQFGFPGPPGPPPPGGAGVPVLPVPGGGAFPALPGTGGQGMMVFDPAHIVETIANGQQILKQIEHQVRQIEHQVRMLEKLANPPWRTIDRHLLEMERLMRQKTAIAYSTGDLRRVLTETFPGTAPYVAWAEEYGAQLRRVLHTQENVLMSLQEHGEQLSGSHQQLRAIKDRMQTAEGQTGALELGNTLSAFTAEELMLVRQLIAAQTNATTAYHAYAMNREAQLMATRQEFFETALVPLTGNTYTGGSRDLFRQGR